MKHILLGTKEVSLVACGHCLAIYSVDKDRRELTPDDKFKCEVCGEDADLCLSVGLNKDRLIIINGRSRSKN